MIYYDFSARRYSHLKDILSIDHCVSVTFPLATHTSAPEKTIRFQNIRRIELITTENEMYNKFLPKADQQAFHGI